MTNNYIDTAKELNKLTPSEKLIHANEVHKDEAKSLRKKLETSVEKHISEIKDLSKVHEETITQINEKIYTLKDEKSVVENERDSLKSKQNFARFLAAISAISIAIGSNLISSNLPDTFSHGAGCGLVITGTTLVALNAFLGF